MASFRQQLSSLPEATEAAIANNASEAEAMLRTFARQADISRQDAYKLITDPECTSVRKDKRKAFEEAVAADSRIGTIESLRTRVKAAESGGPKPA